MSSTDRITTGRNTLYKSQFVGLDDEPCDTKCLKCDDTFILPTDGKGYLTHLFEEHRLVIGDVWKIASLKSYIHYWSVKFKEEPLNNFCTMLAMDCTPDGKPSKNEYYYLLSDCISEDKTLRDELHRAKLEWVLAKQLEERNDTNFKRGCIFCRMEICGSRHAYVEHLSRKHNLHIGRPENLVFLDELFDKIQNSIERLICLYCEKVFKDRTALKDHMRKKQHKRINPNNGAFDKFYVNNYLECGQIWRQKRLPWSHEQNANADDVSSGNEDDETTWSDWNGESVDIRCLFCTYSDKDFCRILGHVKTEHNFNFEDISKGLTIYQKIKVVNYLRRQMHVSHCILCDAKVENVLEHMEQNNHCRLPSRRIWDEPEFYFPMYENDSFLYHLETNSNSDKDSDAEDVTPVANCIALKKS